MSSPPTTLQSQRSHLPRSTSITTLSTDDPTFTSTPDIPSNKGLSGLMSAIEGASTGNTLIIGFLFGMTLGLGFAALACCWFPCLPGARREWIRRRNVAAGRRDFYGRGGGGLRVRSERGWMERVDERLRGFGRIGRIGRGGRAVDRGDGEDVVEAGEGGRP